MNKDYLKEMFNQILCLPKLTQYFLNLELSSKYSWNYVSSISIQSISLSLDTIHLDVLAHILHHALLLCYFKIKYRGGSRSSAYVENLLIMQHLT